MSAARSSVRRRNVPVVEETVEVLDVEQVEEVNPVNLEEEPIDIEQADEQVDEETHDAGEENIDIGALLAQSQENSEQVDEIPEEVQEEIPEPSEELPAPVVETSAAPSEPIKRRARRVAANDDDVVESQAEPSAAPSVATPKSNVSGGKFAALTKKTASVSSAPTTSKPNTSRFASLTGKAKTSVVTKLTPSEYFAANVQEKGPVALINEMFPTVESVKALPRAEYVKIRNYLCWLADMSEKPFNSQFVGAYHSLIMSKQKNTPTHIKLDGANPAYFQMGDEEIEVQPHEPCVYPGDDNEMAAESEFRVFTFRTQLEEFPVEAQIAKIDEFVSEYEL